MNVLESESQPETQEATLPSEGQWEETNRRLKLANLIFDHIENGAVGH